MALFSNWKKQRAERTVLLISQLRKQAVTQKYRSNEAVRLHGAYPDDNDHIDAAVLMLRAADALETLT